MRALVFFFFNLTIHLWWSVWADRKLPIRHNSKDMIGSERLWTRNVTEISRLHPCTEMLCSLILEQEKGDRSDMDLTGGVVVRYRRWQSSHPGSPRWLMHYNLPVLWERNGHTLWVHATSAFLKKYHHLFNVFISTSCTCMHVCPPPPFVFLLSTTDFLGNWYLRQLVNGSYSNTRHVKSLPVLSFRPLSNLISVMFLNFLCIRYLISACLDDMILIH